MKKRKIIGMAVVGILAIVLLAVLSVRQLRTKAFEKIAESRQLVTTVATKKDISQQLSVLEDYPEVAVAVAALPEATDYDMFAIPGLYQAVSLNTETGKLARCHEMTPQGVTVNDNYLFISAYCHDHQHNSVIYQLDRKTKMLLKTIPVAGQPHLGGIWYDKADQQLFLATEEDRRAAASTLSLATIQDYELYSDPTPDPIKYTATTQLQNVRRTSFLTGLPPFLVVGYFDRGHRGTLAMYPIDDQGQISSLKETGGGTYEISDEKTAQSKSATQGNATQGTATQEATTQETTTQESHFQEAGATSDFRKDSDPQEAETADTSGVVKKVQGVAYYQEYMLLSQSFGHHDSSLLLFDLQDTVGGFTEKSAKMKITFPPYLEQIAVDGDRLLAVFESGAAAYRHKTSRQMEYVLQLDLKTLLKSVKQSK